MNPLNRARAWQAGHLVHSRVQASSRVHGGREGRPWRRLERGTEVIWKRHCWQQGSPGALGGTGRALELGARPGKEGRPALPGRRGCSWPLEVQGGEQGWRGHECSLGLSWGERPAWACRGWKGQISALKTLCQLERKGGCTHSSQGRALLRPLCCRGFCSLCRQVTASELQEQQEEAFLQGR